MNNAISKYCIERYYRQYSQMVQRRCRSILGDEEKAKDAMQDVFLTILSKKGKLNITSPSSLLYTMATNISLNILKREKREILLENEETLSGNSRDPLAQLILRESLDTLFHNEKESTREITEMLFLERMTLSKVAHIQGLSVSGIRRRVEKLRKKSQYCFEKDYLRDLVRDERCIA